MFWFTRSEGLLFLHRQQRLIKLIVHVASYQWKCSWGAVWNLKLKTAMNLSFACYTRELEYEQRLNRLY